MREYFDACLKPFGIGLEITKTRSIFTGVDGKPEPGLGLCRMKLTLLGEDDATWTTDLIGGSGSKSPMLLANDTLRTLQARGRAEPHRSG